MSDHEDREQQLNEALAAYLEAQERGWAPPRQRLLDCYPEFADDLERFFSAEERVERVTGPLRPVVPENSDSTLDPSSATIGEPQRPEVPGYEIVEEIGRGGMGVVYKARQTKANRVVALKMILAGKLADADARARFRTEAEAVARLQHPGIVQIHEVGELDNLPYFSMELCVGGSLADYLDGTPLPPAAAARLVEALARAVQASHEQHIIHRDLKPANVLLASGSASGAARREPAGGETAPAGLRPAALADWVLKLTDFGLAKMLDAEGPTASNAIVGTPSYMAPEQAQSRRHPVSPATDVYALGAILYELLTGRPPFKAAIPLDTILQVISDEPVPPRQLQPKTPRDLETICLKCLQKLPEKRYTSATELAEDLRRFQAGEPIKARPVGSWERSVKWLKRKPGLAALLALCGLALTTLVVGGIVFTLQLDQAREQAEQNEADAREQKNQTEQQLGRARDNLMTAQLMRVAAVYERDAMTGLSLLRDPEACPPALRDAAWGFYYHVCRRELPHGGHQGRVNSVAFSRDGRWLVSAGSDDRTVRLWEVPTGKEQVVIRGHPDGVYGVVISPDGRILGLGSGGREGTMQLWDVAAGKARAVFWGDTRLLTCRAVSPDGQTLASGEVRSLPVGGVGGRNGTIRLRDIVTGKERTVLRGHSGPVSRVTFSPDGQTLASTDGWDRTLRLWEVATGKERAVLRGVPGGADSVAISSDRQTLAFGCLDGTVCLWEVATGKERAVLRGFASPWVTAVAFSSDGRTLAAACEDGAVRLWEVSTGKPRAVLGNHARTVRQQRSGKEWAVFHSEEQLHAPGGRVGVWLWEVGTGKQRALAREFDKSDVTALAFSPDGKTLAWEWNDGTVRLSEVATGKQRFLEGDAVPRAGRSVTFSPDGKVIACAQFGLVSLWDVSTGKQREHLRGHSREVISVAFSRDGQWLASGGADQTVRLWERSTGKERAVLHGHGYSVDAVAFSPDGQTLASGGGDGVRLWEVATGKPRAFLRGQAAVTAVAFSPDGQTLASGESDGVRLWHPGTGQERAVIREKEVRTVVFCPDGKYLATGRGAVAFSPDGKYLAAGDAVKLWLVLPGEDIPDLSHSPR